MENSHMTFFWGNAGNGKFMTYILELGSAFFLSVAVEWLSHTRFIDPESNKVVAGLVQTALYSIRITLAYLVMLQVMSFDVWILVVAVAGYSLGFLIFGSRVFDHKHKDEEGLYQKPSDLPPLNC